MLCALSHLVALQSKTHLKEESKGRRGMKLEKGDSGPPQSICTRKGLDVESHPLLAGCATDKLGCSPGDEVLPIRRLMDMVMRAAYQYRHQNACLHGGKSRLLCLHERRMGNRRGTASGWVVVFHKGICGYIWNDAMLLHMFMQAWSQFLLHRCLCCARPYDKLG
mmetsp:Transcript_8003/g.49431  ORF Transcript_8003/g.49431 Transcript_8003/m.49431 type:complete len:165 (+) Transcript_8003:424-918(+)